MGLRGVLQLVNQGFATVVCLQVDRYAWQAKFVWVSFEGDPEKAYAPIDSGATHAEPAQALKATL